MIKKILLYSVVVVLIVCVILFFLAESFYQKTPTNYNYKHEQLVKNYASVQTLVFGDSHAFYGLNPSFLKTKTLNVSNNFQPIYIDKLLFEKHVDSFPQLKNIILTVTEGNLNESYANNLKNLKYYYANQMGLEIPKESSFSLKANSLVFTKSITETYKLYKSVQKGKTFVTSLPNGFTTLNAKENSVENLELSAQNKFKNTKKTSLHISKNIERLQAIINSCKAKRIQVYLVSFPLSNAYLKGLDKEQLNAVQVAAQALAKQNSNANYINFLDNQFFENSDFYDANHLNAKGAEKCTKLISELID